MYKQFVSSACYAVKKHVRTRPVSGQRFALSATPPLTNGIMAKDKEKRPRDSASAGQAKDAPSSPENKPKKAKSGSGLPTEPTGTRYEESMRAEKLTSEKLTIMSWNVAGA